MDLPDRLFRSGKGFMVYGKGNQALEVKGGKGHLRVCYEMIQTSISFCSKEDEIYRS